MKARTAVALIAASAIALSCFYWVYRSARVQQRNIKLHASDASETKSVNKPSSVAEFPPSSQRVLRCLGVLGDPAPQFDVVVRDLISLHEALLARSTRQATLASLRSVWSHLPPLAKIAVAFLVGGYSDPEIAAFRGLMLGDADPRVIAFVGRITLMGEVDETPSIVTDRQERLRLRFDGELVAGFNAKDYPFFWECAFYEIFTKLGDLQPNQEFMDAFELRYKIPGLPGLSKELALYNECFSTELTDTEIRSPLLKIVEHLQPSEAKSMIFRMLLYRLDGRVPSDTTALAHRMTLDASEDDLDRYLCVRRLREGATSDSAGFFRDVLAVEISRPRPNFGIAREIVTGLLGTSPGELSNPNSRYLIMKLVANVAMSEDHHGELTWIIPDILNGGDGAIRKELDQLALEIGPSSPLGAKKIRELLAAQQEK